MTYEQIKNLKEKEFKRLCGVKPKLFDEMVDILKQELPKPRQRERTCPHLGQPKLTIEDQLLIALQYWREYRTYFHIWGSWGIHESTVCRIVHRVENKLIKSRKFSLPGKKALVSSNAQWEVVRTLCVPVVEDDDLRIRAALMQEKARLNALKKTAKFYAASRSSLLCKPEREAAFVRKKEKAYTKVSSSN